MCVFNSCGDNQASELPLNVSYGFVSFLLNKQVVWVGVFREAALLENKHSISIDDSGQSVGNDEHSAVLKALTKSPLNQAIRFEVNIRCSLVNDQNFGLPDYSASEA